MKRHRKGCEVWQNRDEKSVKQARMRATSLALYGVEHANQTDEVRARTAATNLERYGAANPFSREASTFGKVQSALDGKRPVLKGTDNPFAREDVKAKVRDHWMGVHGVTNPQQVADIRARTKATTIERYGGELLASPTLTAKARATNQDRYGDAFPQRTDAVKGRQRETNLSRYGVPWTSQDPSIRQKQFDTHCLRYGTHWLASDVGKTTIRNCMLSAYGVDHPRKHPEINARAEASRIQTMLERYGAPTPVEAGLIPTCRTSPEVEVERMNIRGLYYTGNHAYWVRVRVPDGLSRSRNPDFVYYTSDQLRMVQEGKPANEVRSGTFVEVLGDYWHGLDVQGLDREAYIAQRTAEYASIGVRCLFIWESEVFADTEGVRQRIVEFLGPPIP